MHVLRLSAMLILILAFAPQRAPAQDGAIVVNGEPLTGEEVATYGVDLPPGRYWYDSVSGLWGAEGSGYAGQTAAGLPLGGPLQPDSSLGDTGVFFNNREIHASELAELLQIFSEVPPGRYWLDANLVGGVEGQPASFDLKASAAPPAGEGGYFEDRVTDFCVQNDCPSDLRGAIDDMNSYVPDYGGD